jgi:hypothetical protein
MGDARIAADEIDKYLKRKKRSKRVKKSGKTK